MIFNSMKNFTDQGQLDADSAEDVEVSVERLEQQLVAAQDRLRELASNASAREIAELQISIGGTLVDLQRGEEGFEISRQAFDNFCQEKLWDGAVQACDVMFQADQSESLAEELLAVYFLEARKELLIEWLDTLGIEHDEGSLKDDEPKQPSKKKLGDAVKSFRAIDDDSDRELLLAAFAALSAIDWPALDALIGMDA